MVSLAVSSLTQIGHALSACEKFAADNLGIGLKETEPVAVPVACKLVMTQTRESLVKLNIPCKELSRGSHDWIFDVVTNSCQCPAADQLTLTELIPVATDLFIEGMTFGKTLGGHLGRF